MGWYSIVWEGRDVRLWAMGRCWSRRPTTSTFSTTLSCAWGGSGAGGLSYRGARWRLKAALHARSPRIGRIVREAQAKVRIAMLVCVHIYVCACLYACYRSVDTAETSPGVACAGAGAGAWGGKLRRLPLFTFPIQMQILYQI